MLHATVRVRVTSWEMIRTDKPVVLTRCVAGNIGRERDRKSGKRDVEPKRALSQDARLGPGLELDGNAQEAGASLFRVWKAPGTDVYLDRGQQ